MGGTAMWLIDVLALIINGEKSDDEADADIVGKCSLLRVEYFTFGPDGSDEVESDFF